VSSCFSTSIFMNWLIRTDPLPSDILVPKCEKTGATEIVLMAHGIYEVKPFVKVFHFTHNFHF
jgi:hypothetical protein